MQAAEVVELVVAGAATLLLGLVVLSRNWQQSALRWFFVLCLAVSLWSWGIALYTRSADPASTLFWANFYYGSALAIAAASQIFTSYWLRSRKTAFYTVISGALVAFFIVVLVLEPHFIVASAALTGSHKAVALNRLGYGLYSILFVVMFAASVARLIRGSYDLRGLHRLQTHYIASSLIFAGVFGAFFNLILPWFGNYSLVWIGPLSAVIFVAFVCYAIVRQKLFDIRAFVLRAVVYLFSTALLSLLYIVPAVLLVAAVIHVHFTWGRLVWGVAVATLFALFYSRVRGAFNTLTNRIFFRGYYEPQEVLNQLSEILVRSIEVEYIKKQSTRIILGAIKAGQLEYWLVTDEGYGRRQPQLLERLFHGAGATNVVITDRQPEGSRPAEILREQDVAALVRLRTGSAVLGFLALGFKESGEAYTERDKQLLNIASDEIAIALQNALHFQEIRHFNQTLQGKVAQATKELRRSNEKLHALDETKDEFITMASHQLRTPLTSVKGYLSMVLEGDAGKITAQQRQLLNQSYQSAQRMVFLISDLLNLSRLNTGKFVIESSPVDLREVVQAEIGQVAETAKSREVTLNYDNPASFPKLMLDETKIHQVVMNFIDNAIYYTPAGGSITVSLSETPTTVEYRVKDTGIGVPRAVQHRLFSKFYRADNARRARPDGTGLGLFMAKKVIAAQGGAIIFESEEGKGSTFGFRFSKTKLQVTSSKDQDIIPGHERSPA